MEFWDPIGVQDAPEAWDEYDGCVASVYRLLVRKASPAEIVQHLHGLEVREMGLCSAADAASRLEPVARRLLALDVSMDDGEGPGS